MRSPNIALKGVVLRTQVYGKENDPFRQAYMWQLSAEVLGEKNLKRADMYRD